MRTGLTAQQYEILWSDSKKIKWLFEITLTDDTTYYWSNESTTYNGQDYDFKILDFDNLKLQMIEPYANNIPEQRINIEILMKDSHIDGYSSQDFENATVKISLIASADLSAEIIADDDTEIDAAEFEEQSQQETEIISWKFLVENAYNLDQVLIVECLDFFSFYLEGDYPTSATISELFPNKIMAEDNVCVPVIYGTPYIPLRWIVKHLNASYISSNQFSVVGDYTDLFSTNQFLQANCGTDGYKSCFVSSSSYGSDITTVTLNTATSQELTSELTQVDIDAYVLGFEDTYSILEASSPKESHIDGKSRYTSSDYTFKQDTIVGSDNTSYNIVQLLGTDGDGDNSNDSNAFFPSGGKQVYDVPFKFYSSSVDTTSPIDIIVDLLENFGLESDYIDSTSVAEIRTELQSRDIKMNVGLYYTQDRKTLLNKICTLAGVIPVIRDKVYFKLLTKTPQLSLDENLIDPHSFVISSQYTFTNKQKDSGYVRWQTSSESCDKVNKSLIAAKSLTEEKSEETIDAEFLSDEVTAKKCAKLALQRILLKNKSISFQSKSKILIMEPGDIIRIENMNQGALYDSTSVNPYDVLITSISIGKGLLLSIEGNSFSDDLNDWNDITVSESGPEDVENNNGYQAVIQGPDDASGINAPNSVIQNLLITDGCIKTNLRPSSNGGFIATNTHLRCYNKSGSLRFESVYDESTDDGDLTVGDYNEGQGFKWDESASILDVQGKIQSTSGAIGGWNIDTSTLQSVSAGAGITLDSSNPSITLTDTNSYDRVFIGKSGTDYGIKIRDENNDLIVQLDDNVKTISGWTAGTTALAVSSNIILDASNKKISINDSTFGNKGIQLEYNSGFPQFYCGNGSNDFLKYSYPNGLEISTTKSDGITIQNGADITFNGSDSDPGKIKFYGTSYNTELGSDVDGNRFLIKPSSCDNISFYIGLNGAWWGGTDSRFKYLRCYSTRQCLFSSGDWSGAYNGASIEIQGDLSEVEPTIIMNLYHKTLQTQRTYYFNHSYFGPADNKAQNLGRASYAWDDVYADDFNNVADFYFMDKYKDGVLDDLKLLTEIKSSDNVSPAGFLYIDDDTIPEILLSKDSSGTVLRDSEGKPYLSLKLMISLLMGAVRQLEKRTRKND